MAEQKMKNSTPIIIIIIVGIFAIFLRFQSSDKPHIGDCINVTEYGEYYGSNPERYCKISGNIAVAQYRPILKIIPVPYAYAFDVSNCNSSICYYDDGIKTSCEIIIDLGRIGSINNDNKVDLKYCN